MSWSYAHPVFVAMLKAERHERVLDASVNIKTPSCHQAHSS
jgi:hypothetical protein